MEDSGDYFSLKWSNFRSSLTEGFHDFLQEEAMVDVTLAAEGKFVQAHKLVLSVCSPYFKNLFKVNPCKHPIVILKDVGHNDLSYMLEFMYKGEVGVKHEDLPSFLKLADTLKVKGLAGEKIQKNENTKNLDLNMARVRKKFNRDSVSEVNKENSEFHSSGEPAAKKILRSKKRKLSCKSKLVKKFKSEKCVDSVNKCNDDNNDNVSEDEDDNPLIKFIGGDDVKSGECSKQSESCRDNENESQCDNKTSFSMWSDGVPESDDSGGQDMSRDFFQSGCSEETDQAPQGGVDYQMIQTKRGRDMLLFAGYTFTQNRMCKDGMRWQCSYPKCKAFCRMSSAGWLTPYKTHHDHPKPSEREIKKRILRMELKARAQSSGATPGEILRNALPAEEFHSTDRACFTRCIQRFRKSLQRKNSKVQEEVWQAPVDVVQSGKDSLKTQPPTNGEPSWLTNPRPLLSVGETDKNSGWHQEPVGIVKQAELLDGKGILQGKMESYGI